METELSSSRNCESLWLVIVRRSEECWQSKKINQRRREGCDQDPTATTTKKWRENSAVGSSGSPYSTRLQVGHTLCGYRWVILYAVTGGSYSMRIQVGHILRGYRWVILYANKGGSHSTQLKASCIFCTIITDILMICYQIIMSSWCNKNSN